jgi:hypothetical protein
MPKTTPPPFVDAPLVATDEVPKKVAISRSPPRASRCLKRFWGLARVSLLASAVSAIALTARVHSARASLDAVVDRILVGSERSLSPMVNSLRERSYSTLVLNGARIRVQSGHAQRGAGELKRQFQKECPSATFLTGSIFGAEGPENGWAPPNEKPGGPPGFTGTCLWSDTGIPLGSPYELATAASRGLPDASQMSASILFARELPVSEGPRSQSLRFEVPLRALLEAFPESGDTPGSDPSFVARPAGRRLLSVRLESASHHGQDTSSTETLFMYEASGLPEVVLRDYVASVSRTNLGLKPVSEGTLAHTFRDSDGYFAAIAASSPNGTLLTIVRL